MFNLPLISAATIGLAVVVAAVWSPAHDPLTDQQRRDIHQLAQYRAFAYAAHLYLKENATFTGTLTWSMLKASATTPEGMRSGEVHGSFKAVVTSATDYVICGELPEGAATAINQLMPATDQARRSTSGDMVFSKTQLEADEYAAKCGA